MKLLIKLPLPACSAKSRMPGKFPASWFGLDDELLLNFDRYYYYYNYIMTVANTSTSPCCPVEPAVLVGGEQIER